MRVASERRFGGASREALKPWLPDPRGRAARRDVAAVRCEQLPWPPRSDARLVTVKYFFVANFLRTILQCD
jgi:hypothetical protein